MTLSLRRPRPLPQESMLISRVNPNPYFYLILIFLLFLLVAHVLNLFFCINFQIIIFTLKLLLINPNLHTLFILLTLYHSQKPIPLQTLILSASSLWNSLPLYIRSAPSVNSFISLYVTNHEKLCHKLKILKIVFLVQLECTDYSHCHGVAVS